MSHFACDKKSYYSFYYVINALIYRLYEENELDNSITLKTLKKAAEAMDCKLVYAIVPNQGKLEDIVKKQAYHKAKFVVIPVNHTMLLEAQEVGNLKEKIAKTADELANELNSKFWNK